MWLYLHFPTNLKLFELFLENQTYLLGWNSKEEKEIWIFFNKYFPWELEENLSSQYKVNIESLKELKRVYWQNLLWKLKWIYYWSDNCEYLVPTKLELEKAYNLYIQYFKKNKSIYESLDFILVTPYVGEKMLLRLKESLDFLNEKWKERNKIFEVVVNDYWTLNYIKTKSNLKPILWRIIHKLLKTPLVDTFWYNIHLSWNIIKNKSKKEIDKLKELVILNQKKFYNDFEWTFSPYNYFLNKNNIWRLTLDYMSTRENLYNHSIWKSLDIYYPWAIIFTWRLCDTSAIEQPKRGFYAIDDICTRACNRYDLFYHFKTKDYSVLQRWNAGYRSEVNLENLINSKIWKNKETRLIYSPFIPV